MSVTPYLMVERAQAFSDFVTRVFDAEVTTRVPLPAAPDRVVHAEARIGSGTLYFADSGPDGSQCQSSPTEPAHLQLWLTVPDADATHARAVADGATPAMEVAGQDDGARIGGFVAFGALWWVTTAS